MPSFGAGGDTQMETHTTSGNGSTSTERLGSGLGEPRDTRARANEADGEDGQSGLTSGAYASRGLGLFSIGLGLAQLTATAAMSRAVLGSDKRRYRNAMRAVGLREITAGLGILSRPRSATWLWSRVAGDAMDLALLGLATRANRTKLSNVSIAAAAVLGVGLLDVLASRRVGRQNGTRAEKPSTIKVTKAITIDRAPADVYGFWRNLQNLPRFMEMIEWVQPLDNRRSHWRGRVPGGASFEWDSEIVDDQINERIAWRSAATALWPNTGEVRFAPAPGGRGTQVTLTMESRPPGGAAVAAAARLVAKAPEMVMLGDLRRCKQLLELGEVVHSDASIARGMHPAQPSASQRTTPRSGTRVGQGGGR
jgi:uncharacterized membrane protein